jgi:hypothetical protein
MADYTPQDMRNLILKFFPGSYTPQTFENVVLNFELRTSYEGSGNLQAAIYAQSTESKKDLSAYINILMSESLPASIGGEIAPDLPAYLKVWPMKQLSSRIYGWGQLDLSAYIYSIQQGNLPAIIGIESPIDLGVILRAWAREVPKDLGAYISSLQKDLQGIIRATYLKDLPAYLYCVKPRDLSASIYGYGLTDLPAYLNGVYGPYDLRASLNITNNYKDLSAYLDPNTGVREPSDLSAYVRGWNAGDIGAYIYSIACVNLNAYLGAQGYVGDLAASIYPKTIRLTSVVSIITMEHLDLSAVVNPSCIWSEPRDLAAYLRCVYKSDLSATLLGKRYDTGVANLYSTIGHADTYSLIDKLPISVSITTKSYRFVDKFPIYFRFFADTRTLAASIVGTYLYKNLSASISGAYLDPYHFANVKNKQKVYKLSASGIAEWFEMVELSFKSIVRSYYYIKISDPYKVWADAGTQWVDSNLAQWVESDLNQWVDSNIFSWTTLQDALWKTDRLDKWILDVSSYIPVNIKLATKRKFHKLKYVYDLNRFDSIDEAVRYAIDFVTDYPKVDFPASIYASGGYKNMQAFLNVRRVVQENYDLDVSITGQSMGDVIIGIDGDGIAVI